MRFRQLLLVVATVVVLILAGWIGSMRPSASLRPTSSSTSSEPDARQPLEESFQSEVHDGVTDRPLIDEPGPSGPAWKEDYYAAGDRGDFVIAAAAASEAGDATASYYVGLAIADCALVISLVRKGNEEPGYLAAVKQRYTRPEDVARQRAEYRRCASLGQRPEFADWHQGAGGLMSAAHWRQLAAEQGSSIAKADLIALSVGNERSAAEIEVLRGYARDIVRASDADALFAFGFTTLSNGASQPKYAVALALAACDFGYDCSVRNPRAFWFSCDEHGACASPRSFRQWVQDGAPPQFFADAYALSEQYKDAVSRGAWNELNWTTSLDGLETAQSKKD